MPKIKTNSGAKKRFALTGTGKIKRKHAFKSHILTKKTKKQKRKMSMGEGRKRRFSANSFNRNLTGFFRSSTYNRVCRPPLDRRNWREGSGPA